jgi:hypothetical protein
MNLIFDSKACPSVVVDYYDIPEWLNLGYRTWNVFVCTGYDNLPWIGTLERIQHETGCLTLLSLLYGEK